MKIAKLLGLLWLSIGACRAQTIALPNGTAGELYHKENFTLLHSNPNQAKLKFAITQGTLPTGMTLSDDGFLKGIPIKSGTFTFTARAELGQGGDSYIQDYTLNILPAKLFLTPSGHSSGCPDGQGCSPRIFKPGPELTSQSLSINPIFANESMVTINTKLQDKLNIYRNGATIASADAAKDGIASYSLPSGSSFAPGEQVKVCQPAANPPDTVCASVNVRPIRRFGEQFRAIVGFQQSGASGADSTQKFFFDFYTSRPVPALFHADNSGRDPVLRWWGNVRIGTAPISSTSAISLSSLRTAAQGLKANELAQSAEFLTGLDIRLSSICCPLLGQSSDSTARFALSGIIAYGANGALNAPAASVPTVFTVPADVATNPLYQPFLNAYPSAKGAAYLSFSPPPQDRYFQEMWAGFRLTTRYADKYGTPEATPPAMVSALFGQNEQVTGGRMRGIVGRVEVFYPLATKNTNTFFSMIYLFGSAQLRIGGASALPVPFDAVPAQTASSLTNSQILNLVDRSSRDFYNIGVGIDLVQILDKVKIAWK